MKKKQRKSVQKKLAASVVALIALGFGWGVSVQGAECTHLGTHGKCSCSSRVLPNIQHEMVPHVVLPETIQYNSVSHTQRRPNFDLDRAGDYGMVNPFVATYTAFPSYQVPYMTEMRTVNQSVYPVSPQIRPLPLPAKKEDSELLDDEGFELSSDESLVEPKILLASNTEEIVHAAPLSDLDNDIAQTGIFCQKPAKPPAAWSFTSPIFKAASVPMGWGPAGHSGFISQQGPRGCSTQVGFNPMMGGGMMPQDGMMQPGMMQPGMMQPPMRTFQMGHGAGMGGGMGAGIQAQQLPNGMVLLTAPPDHSRCGLIRCRCGNMPRMMLLPAAPGGMPPQQAPDAAMMYGMPGMMGGMMPGMNPMMNGMAGGMPMQNVGMNGMMQHPLMQQQLMQQQMMQQQMMQPQVQVVPMSVMTPYGPMFAGYQAVPMMDPMQQMMQASMMQNPMGQMTGGMGMGMMPAAVAQQFQQQFQSMQASQVAATNSNEEKDGESSEQLQAPLPLAGQALPGLNGASMIASPYGMMYAQQTNPGQSDDPNNTGMGTSMMNQAMMPQMMYMTPPMMMPQMNGNSFAGNYMTPFGMMTMNPMAGQGMGMNYGMNPMMMGYGMMPCGMNGMNGMNPMMGMGGMNGMNPMGMGGMNRNEGISTTELLMLMMVMNNNKPEPRQGPIRRLFSRIREGRQGRMMDNDPFQQLMQAWSTPYYAPDSMARMPSRSAYPYGYFGAQPGAMDSANYGGFYNLYMGNTSYPGMY